VVLPVDESATDFLGGDRLSVGLVIAGLLALGAGLAVVVDSRRARGATSGGLPRHGAWRRFSSSNSALSVGSRHHESRNDQAPRHAAAHEAIDPDDMIAAGNWSAEMQSAGFFALVPSKLGNPLLVSSAPQPGRHARLDSSATIDAAQDGAIGFAPEPAPVRPSDRGDHGPLSVIRVLAFDQSDGLNHAATEVEVDRLDESSRNLSTVDLTFPYSSSLAACLHDELFTHRSRSS
jgi:hypothetical protein